jgi:kynurenine formamidase
MKYIDLTQTFTNDMPVYPGDPLPELHQIAEISKDGFVDHVLKTGMHVGTHMDAPLHLIDGGKKITDFPPEKFFGRGVLVGARGKTLAGAELLSALNIQAGDIVLVYFGWSEKFGTDEYYQKYPELSEAFAQKLVELKVSMVGMDTPSPDSNPYDIHKLLLAKDILIIENLTNLKPLINHPKFKVSALPMKLEAEAAPCRVAASF